MTPKDKDQTYKDKDQTPKDKDQTFKDQDKDYVNYNQFNTELNWRKYKKNNAKRGLNV